MDNTYPSQSATDSINKTVNQAVSDAKETVSEYGRTASEKVSEYGRAASDTVKAARDYVREHDMQQMMTDVDEFVRRHPTQALIGAAAAGFVLATLMRRH